MAHPFFSFIINRCVISYTKIYLYHYICPTPSHATIPRRFGSTGVVTAGPIQEPSKILQAGPSTVRNCVLLYSNRPSGEIEASWKA